MEERQKVLIVDDRKENLVALRQVLSQVDADVIEATSGNEALKISMHHNFAVAILDVRMPGMDGYELAELLRGDEKNRGTPIIFVTASHFDEVNIFRGYAAGGIDYIFKPIDPKILVGKVSLFLELDRYREELRRHRNHLEELVGERTVELRKRVNEIQCIYAISSLASQPLISLEEVLAETVDLIPPGWRYSDITCARITFDGQVYKTANFIETPWKLSAPIPLKGTSPALSETPSSVDVCYLEERNGGDDAPFLKEERHLISEIARQLGMMIEVKRAEERERHLNAVLRSIRNINQLIVRENQRDRLIQKACDNLVSSRGFQGAWIILTGPFFPDVEGAYAGFEHSHVQKLAAIFQSGSLPKCCRDGRETGGVVATENVSAACMGCPLAGCCRGNSAITLKISYQDKAYGWMGVSFPAKFSLDPEETALLSETAGDIAFAINGMKMTAERVRAEANLRESEKRFRALFEGAVEGILVVDAESHLIRYANPAICRMLGYSRNCFKWKRRESTRKT
jgi:CheY-like chemotaxis protein